VTPSLFLGVDGGNTKTVAIVAKADGTIVGAGRAGCADIYNAENEQAALDEIKHAADSALQAAGAAAVDLVAGAFSVAGANWPEDINLLHNAVQRFGLGRKTHIFNDAIGALRAGTPDGIGIGVTCGTGAAIGARNGRGDIWYSGHWMVALGGAELGRQALQAGFEAHLGLAQPTTLTEAMLDFFEVGTVEEILYRVTARGAEWTTQDQAQLAPILLDRAATGDDVAREIVVWAGTRNAEVALVAAGAVGLAEQPFRLVLNGGVLRHPSRLFADAIRSRVKAAMPAVETIYEAPEPVIGAVLLAMDLAEIPPRPETAERLVATLPGEELFET
jgi:N-acetylglucosamine kinase-like BadF-type ATPase